jgi:hypothetical protein
MFLFLLNLIDAFVGTIFVANSNFAIYQYIQFTAFIDILQQSAQTIMDWVVCLTYLRSALLLTSVNEKFEIHAFRL